MHKLLTLWIALAAIVLVNVSAPAHAYGCKGWPQLIGGNGCNSSIVAAGGSLLPTGPAIQLEAAAANLFTTIAGGTNVASNGDTVGRWVDLSGNGKNLVATADNTTRPTWQSNSGHPYVSFNGSTSFLHLASSLGLYAGTNFSLFCKYQAVSITSQANLVGESSTAGGIGAYIRSSQSNPATDATAFIRDDASTNAILVTDIIQNVNALANSADHVYGVTADGTTFKTYVDSGTLASNSAYSTGAGTFVPDRFTIGGQERSTVGSWASARVYACIAYKRVLTGTEIGNIITYMNAL